MPSGGALRLWYWFHIQSGRDLSDLADGQAPNHRLLSPASFPEATGIAESISGHRRKLEFLPTSHTTLRWGRYRNSLLQPVMPQAIHRDEIDFLTSVR